MRRAVTASALLAAAVLALLAAACDEEKSFHECQIGRPEGSGYPSPCVPGEGCADGSVCGAISPTHEVGVCARPCETDGDCSVEFECTGEGRCILEDADASGMLCAFTCENDDDCPLNMQCSGYSGLSLCYPNM